MDKNYKSAEESKKTVGDWLEWIKSKGDGYLAGDYTPQEVAYLLYEAHSQFQHEAETVYVKVSVEDELPKMFTKHVIFISDDGVAFDCKFWFDAVPGRTHIEPNLHSLKHYMDSAMFTHWLKEVPLSSIKQKDSIK